ncbi:MAG TPA: hypothetical protein VGS19_14580, partial [Streptosporangiaceae bacterium]|nr:hypothetical protein [Streptosporangiaceae bacterium]
MAAAELVFTGPERADATAGRGATIGGVLDACRLAAGISLSPVIPPAPWFPAPMLGKQAGSQQLG